MAPYFVKHKDNYTFTFYSMFSCNAAESRFVGILFESQFGPSLGPSGRHRCACCHIHVDS